MITFKIVSKKALEEYEKYIFNKNSKDILISFDVQNKKIVMYTKSTFSLSFCKIDIDIIENSAHQDELNFVIATDKFYALLKLVDKEHTLSLEKKLANSGVLTFITKENKIILPITFKEEINDFIEVFNSHKQLINESAIKFYASNEAHKKILTEFYAFLLKANSFFGKSLIDILSIHPTCWVISNERMIIKKEISFIPFSIFFSPDITMAIKDLFNLEHENFIIAFNENNKMIVEDENFFTIITLVSGEDAISPELSVIENLREGQTNFIAVNAHDFINHINFLNSFYSSDMKNKIVYCKFDLTQRNLILSLKDTFSYNDTFLIQRTMTDIDVLDNTFETFEIEVRYNDLLFASKNAEGSKLTFNYQKEKIQQGESTLALCLNTEIEKDTNYFISYEIVEQE